MMLLPCLWDPLLRKVVDLMGHVIVKPKSPWSKVTCCACPAYTLSTGST